MSSLNVPSSVFIILIGKIPCKIVNLLRKSPITLSTWIRTAAISWVSSTDFCCSWDSPQVNSCFNWAQYKPTDSWIVKPRSPGSKFFSRPQFSVRHTSETRPPQALEIYILFPAELFQLRFLRCYDFCMSSLFGL